MPVPFEIEPAEARDASAILELLANAELTTKDLGPGFFRHFHVCRDEGRVVGSVGVERHGEDGLFRSLAVAPDFRGQGIAGRLMERAERTAAESGLRRLFLLTVTAPEFFRKRGYGDHDRKRVPAGIAATAEFAALCPATAVCLSKRMDSIEIQKGKEKSWITD